ncbi:hypothetical protein [Usitatibacter palustris]|uniref:Uncharacterized protein n=1 Tax=Usitatibacter palustris TaxID=2732487 RepID=A0A6M4H6X7_9PROT|nr:hypothetical protein [Usitatibacter palustris]QJR15356.1 hypothetical protein DSM104440_02175 [Usitatibacter palustris]
MTEKELNAKLAENSKALSEVNTHQEVLPPVGRAETKWWSTEHAMTMCAALLIFGVIVLSMASYLIKSGKKTDSVMKVFGTVLIVTVSVFLVVAGYSESQISPVIGLLGTIAGYILGKEANNEQNPVRRGTGTDLDLDRREPGDRTAVGRAEGAGESEKHG